MHFKTLLLLDVPETKQNPEWEKEVQQKMDEFKAKHPGEIIENAVLGLYIGKLTNVQTTFGLELSKLIYSVMERFYCSTEDPKYLLFEDRTEEYLQGFNAEVECVVMPDGKIREVHDYVFMRDFVIKDGKIYQKFGDTLKRSTTARRMRLLPNYPRSKLYGSFDEYVEDEGGCKNEETGKYGEWYNPNSVYDWFSIGGRWPEMFLVKLDCTDYSYGERSSMDESRYPAPAGYRWVACARKKDIQWQAMREWRNQQTRERFYKLEKMFQSGEIDDSVHRITEEGLFWCAQMIYRKGQTVEEFMAKHGIPDSWKYPINVCGVFTEEEYFDEHDHPYDPAIEGDQEAKWRVQLEEFIDDADDNTVFVGIDYHM